MNIENAIKIDGWMNEQELNYLAMLANGCKLFIEVGSWKGRSTRAIVDNTDGFVICVDTWEGPSEDNIRNEFFKDAVENGSDFVFKQFVENMGPNMRDDKMLCLKMTATDAATYLEKLGYVGKADAVFIDADHTYEHVKEDILNYEKFVKSGGILCGHDYQFPEVYRAVNETLKVTGTESTIWISKVWHP